MVWSLRKSMRYTAREPAFTWGSRNSNKTSQKSKMQYNRKIVLSKLSQLLKLWRRQSYVRLLTSTSIFHSPWIITSSFRYLSRCSDQMGLELRLSAIRHSLLHSQKFLLVTKIWVHLTSSQKYSSIKIIIICLKTAISSRMINNRSTHLSAHLSQTNKKLSNTDYHNSAELLQHFRPRILSGRAQSWQISH